MKPYVIVSPQYDYTSGGIKVMWALYGHLLARGLEVYMNVRPYGKDIVAIYPEILHGNPVEAKTVVRYILNKPGVMESNGIPGPTTFDPTDKLYYFSQLFADTDDAKIMFLPVIDLNTFYVQKGVKRETSCKFIGKGIDTNHKDLEGLLIVDRGLAQDQQGLADYLNTCEVMYCFDPCSAMIEVARLCGCRVVMVNNTQYTKEQFSVYEPGMNGISWGMDEHVDLDAEGFRRQYRDLQAIFNYSLDNFIRETQ